MTFVLLVGLTGGIGAGKSTVARMLGQRGALIVDADDLARRAVDPGTPGFDAVVEAFGPEVVATDGQLDRTKLASLVFADEQARRMLESIVHPEVARLFAEEAARYRDTDTVLVYVVPLLAENNLQDMFDVVVVVTAERAARVARLAASREMNTEDVSGRMDAQLPDEERERVAHVVIRNDGSIEKLQGKVDDLWARLQSSAQEAAGR
jgi:dephospho-CoA kinase